MSIFIQLPLRFQGPVTCQDSNSFCSLRKNQINPCICKEIKLQCQSIPELGYWFLDVKNPMLPNVTSIQLASLANQSIQHYFTSYLLWLCHTFLTTCRVFHCTGYTFTLRKHKTVFSLSKKSPRIKQNSIVE